MILSTHILAGAVIGKTLNNPWWIIVVSFIVHFIMDTFRHGEYIDVFGSQHAVKNSAWKIILDIAIGFLLVFLLIKFKNFSQLQIRNILLGSVASAFPDLITLIYRQTRWHFLDNYYKFHTWLHKYPRSAPEREWTLRNARNDIIISALAILLLFI